MSNPNRPKRERTADELAEELADIELAQAGDQPAMMRLLDRYRPLLKAVVGKARRSRGLQEADAEDLFADLILNVLEAVHGFDTAKGRTLAAILPLRFAGVVSAAIDPIVAIPRSSLSRFYSILKAADGDVNAAAKLAPASGMTADLFWEIHLTLRTGSDEDAEATPWGADLPNTVTEAQAHQVNLALAVLTDKQREVVELAYGFRQLGGRSDDWIASELGKSKSVVRKTREQALAKMRVALADVTEAPSGPPAPRAVEPIDWSLRMAIYRERQAS